MNQDNFKYSEITENIIKAFYKVYNTLGYGFLEKVYENAMVIELRAMGLHVEQQFQLNVYYEGTIVGEYFADLLVEEKVVIENKAAASLNLDNEKQLTNYLKAIDFEVGLLLNFGKAPEFKRKVFSNEH